MLEETIFDDVKCNVNGNIKLKLKEGYVASYSYSNDGINIYTRIIPTSDLETTFKETDDYGYISIFRSGENKSFIQIRIIKK
jgi:argininosuccinate synthase